jgi:hypothetical protein
VRNAVPWFGNMIKIMGEKEGRAFFEALAASQAQMHSGYTNVAHLLAAGEFPLACAVRTGLKSCARPEPPWTGSLP